MTCAAAPAAPAALARSWPGMCNPSVARLNSTHYILTFSSQSAPDGSRPSQLFYALSPSLAEWSPYRPLAPKLTTGIQASSPGTLAVDGRVSYVALAFQASGALWVANATTVESVRRVASWRRRSALPLIARRDRIAPHCTAPRRTARPRVTRPGRRLAGFRRPRPGATGADERQVRARARASAGVRRARNVRVCPRVASQAPASGVDPP